MRLLEYAVALAWAALMAGTAQAAPGAALTRAQALSAIAQPDAALRLAGLQRLARVGAMADAERVLDRLADTDDEVREAAQVVPVAHQAGARVVIINHQPTAMDPLADAVLRASISEVLPAICAA